MRERERVSQVLPTPLVVFVLQIVCTLCFINYTFYQMGVLNMTLIKNVDQSICVGVYA